MRDTHKVLTPVPIINPLSTVFSGISCVQFDDTRIFSGSWDKTIKVSHYSNCYYSESLQHNLLSSCNAEVKSVTFMH